MTLEVRTEKFLLSPVRAMLWTREESWLSLHQKNGQKNGNQFFQFSAFEFQAWIYHGDLSPTDEGDAPLTQQVWGSHLSLISTIAATKPHETQFLCQVFCPGSSLATANATKPGPAKVPRVTYSPLKVPLTADTWFRHHTLGIVPTQGALGSRLAFFIDLPLSHDTRLPLQQPRNNRRKKNRELQQQLGPQWSILSKDTKGNESMQLPLQELGAKSLAPFCGFANSKAALGGPMSSVCSALSWDAHNNVPKMPGCPRQAPSYAVFQKASTNVSSPMNYPEKTM